MTALPRPGLYAVTDTALTRERGLIPCVEAVLRGGAVMVQYRDKSDDRVRRLREARALGELCAEHGATLLINDDIGLAAEAGAAGVHLGRDDATVEQARERLGPKAIVGVSCYHELLRARAAAAAGADYVAYGRFFPSRTKPGRPLATPALLRESSREIALPVAAIGGITAANGADLVAAGAHWLAVIQGLWAAPDCTEAARALSRLYA